MASELKKTSLLNAPDLRVDHFQVGDNRNGMLAFSFTERGSEDLDGTGFAGQFLLGLGFDVVAFKLTSLDWYQRVTEASIREIEAGISRAGIPYGTRVGYGSSTGGYAAVRFSRELALKRVLAISPLFDIRFGWDPRYLSDVKSINVKEMMCARYISSDCLYFFVYDPHCLDSRHIDEYQMIIPPRNCILTKTPYSGHPSGFFLNEVGILKDFAASILLYGRRLHYESIRTDRNRSGWYLHTLALALRDRNKLNWALSICSRATKAHPHNAEVFATLADILHRLGRKDAAEVAATRALALDRHNPHRKLGLAFLLHAVGKFENALVLLDEAIPLVPESDIWVGIRRDCLARLACGAQVRRSTGDPALR